MKQQKHTILIVEDDPYTLELYKEIFEQAGFDVVAFSDADGYFAERVHEILPDIISMDIMIGREGSPTERDGLEAIEILKADLRTSDIPIMVLSNFTEKSKVQKAKDLGAVDFLNLAGLTPKNVPTHYRDYLASPKDYKPVHPIFQKRALIPPRKNS